MSPDPSDRLKELRERDESVNALCVIVKWAPRFYTLLFVIFATVAVVSVTSEGGRGDRIAMTVAGATLPTVFLSWTVAHLVNQVLSRLDIGTPPGRDGDGTDSPRR